MKKSISLVIFAGVAMVGCATINGTVLEYTDGQYKAVVTDYTERHALQKVAADARLTCRRDGYQDFAVVEENVEYIGPETGADEEKGFSKFMLKVVEMGAKRYNAENYRAELVFECSE